MGGLRRGQRVLVERVQGPVHGLEEPDGLPWPPRRESSRNGNWSSCQTPVPVVPAQRVEELEGLHQVHRADHHVVVPAAEVVVDVDREQLAVVDAQLGGVGRGLQAVQGVPEVEQDAEVVQADLLDAQQGARRVRKDDLVTRFARLVLDHELDLRVGADQLAQTVDGQLPDVVVVDLERVVPAVLAEPQLHVVAAQLLGQLGGLVQQRERLGPDGRVGVGDRALDVVPVVDLRA